MVWPITSAIVLFVLMYTLTAIFSKLLIYQNDRLAEYNFKKDVYIYLFLTFFIGVLGIHFIIPNFYDVIVKISTLQICMAFIFSGLIYLLFLLETNAILNISIVAFSVISSFLFVNPTSLIATDIIPWPLEILIIGLVFSCFVFSAKTLIGLPGIFSSYISISMIAIILLSLIGALPLFCTLVASFALGAWVGVFQKNMFDFAVKTNEGALMSAMFLLGSFYLIGINEFCMSSMLILMVYPLCELIWCSIQQYFFKRKKTDLYLNSFYFTGYQKDVSLTSLHLLLFKLGIINCAMSLFQMYSPNAITLPILAFCFNFWLLFKLYYADREVLTLKETNKEVIQNIKDEINNIKQNFKKD